MNDIINLNVFVLLLSHNTGLSVKHRVHIPKLMLCNKLNSIELFVINGAHGDPDCTTVHVLAIGRGSCLTRVKSQAFWM